MHYRIQVGGGLGDVLFQLYDRNVYNVLNDLLPEDTAEVWLVCHNPFADELFTKHPKADQITVHSVGYWAPQDDRAMRRKLGMPESHEFSTLPSKPGPVVFHADLAEHQLGHDYVVVSATAGTSDRRMPQEELDQLVQDFLQAQPDTKLVLVGRNYDRPPGAMRTEAVPQVSSDRVVNLIDRLSVPATLKVVQGARGVITAHTATCLVSWMEHKPTLLLYPQAAYDHHTRHGRPDQWMFGIMYSSTVHAPFGQYTPALMTRFLEQLNAS